jgi:hypothetical protein
MCFYDFCSVLNNFLIKIDAQNKAAEKIKKEMTSNAKKK